LFQRVSILTLILLHIHFKNRPTEYKFGQAKFPNGGSALGSSQFSILPQLHQKMMLASKGVKIDSKIKQATCIIKLNP